MTRFSVAAVAPEERSQHWSNFVSGIFFPMSASFAAPDRFHGTIENWDLGRVSLSRFCSGPVCYDRAKSHLRGRADDDLLITFATRADARFIQGDYNLHCRRNGCRQNDRHSDEFADERPHLRGRRGGPDR